MRISDWSSDVCSSDLPLLGRPGDEAFRGVQIEDIEAVDPRREDDEWDGENLLRRRRIVDELIEIGLVDDLARRRRDIHADLERVGIDVGKLPARQVAQHMFQTLARKSVVSGKSVSVRVDLGGRRILKNKTHTI